MHKVNSHFDGMKVLSLLGVIFGPIGFSIDKLPPLALLQERGFDNNWMPFVLSWVPLTVITFVIYKLLNHFSEDDHVRALQMHGLPKMVIRRLSADGVNIVKAGELLQNLAEKSRDPKVSRTRVIFDYTGRTSKTMTALRSRNGHYMVLLQSFGINQKTMREQDPVEVARLIIRGVDPKMAVAVAEHDIDIQTFDSFYGGFGMMGLQMPAKAA
jgi:hypothetical protein